MSKAWSEVLRAAGSVLATTLVIIGTVTLAAAVALICLKGLLDLAIWLGLAPG